jgi:hypothetical protein
LNLEKVFGGSVCKRTSRIYCLIWLFDIQMLLTSVSGRNLAKLVGC